MKFEDLFFFGKPVQKIQVSLTSDKNEAQRTVFFIIFRSVLLRMTMHHHQDHHHHHHISVMELGHLLTRSSLTYPEVSSKVYHDSFCQLDSSVSLPWVI